jgi:hypothetical protein
MARQALTGSRVRDRRQLLGLKQADLARAVGVSPAYLNLIEHNRRRVGAELLAALALALKVEPVALAEGGQGALFDALREAAAAPEPGVLPELDRIEEFAGRFPGWAGLLAARQGQVGRLSRTVEALSERLAQDPFLAASLHEVLSAITAVRSTSAILTETEDIEPEWRARFHRNIHEDSVRLSNVSAALVAWLDRARAPEAGLASPQEELENWLAARGWHLPQVERGMPDAEALIAAAPELVSPAAKLLAREHIMAARADAQALPLPPFLAALAEDGPDPAGLARRFGAPMPQVMRRMAALPEEATPAGLGLVAADGTGTLTFRRAAPGFPLPRYGAACALWPLFEALARPVTPIRRVLRAAGRGAAGARFLTYAWCDRSHPGGFDAPAVSRALMLILPQPGGTGDEGLAVGPSCRICPETACAARREPSILV